MRTLAFDTHKAVKALQAAGAAEPLAEAVVATVGEAVGDNVATKADLAEVQAGLETEIEAVRADLTEVQAGLKTEIAEVRTEIAEVKAELKTDIALLRADTEKGFQGVYKFMMVSTLAIISTIIGGSIALVRYLAP